jgi:hypothetical protein
VLSYFQNGIGGHYHVLQLKTNEKEKINNSNRNINIDISEYLGENNSSSIEIEPNNNYDHSIITYNNNISLEHTNVIEKELNINSSLFNDFINYDKLIINKNVPKNYKQIRLTLPSSRLFPRIYNSSSGLTSNKSIVIEDDDNDSIVIEDDDDDEIDWDVNKQNIIKYFTPFRNFTNKIKRN